MSVPNRVGFSFWSFAGGVATGVVIAKYWPTLWGMAKPYARSAVAKGAKAFEGGKELVKNKAERFSDVIEEIKEEEEQRKTGGKPSKGTPA